MPYVSADPWQAKNFLARLFLLHYKLVAQWGVI